MADTQNTEVPPASEPQASVTTAAPATVVRERSNWATPLVAALVVAATLVLGGVGGFALAAATHAGGPPAIQMAGVPGQMQHGPHQGGPQQGPGPQGERPDRPERPFDDSNESDETEQDGSTEG
jgi:hypothetical protein